MVGLSRNPWQLRARDGVVRVASPISGRRIRSFRRLDAWDGPDPRHTDVVSFDIFDTLLVRPIMTPADAFLWLGPATGRAPSAARQLRMEAERVAIERAVSEGRDETTLREIHEAMAERAGCDPATTMQAELEIEKGLCRAHSPAKRLHDSLVERNVFVVFTTDTYLPPRVVSGLLSSAGFCDPDALVVSSEAGVTKRAGGLFTSLASRLGVPLNRVVHVGDTLTPDVVRPLQHGMRAVFVPRPIDQLRVALRSAGVGLPVTSDADRVAHSIVVGATANRYAAAQRESDVQTHVDDVARTAVDLHLAWSGQTESNDSSTDRRSTQELVSRHVDDLKERLSR